MPERDPLATHTYAAGELSEALEFLKRTRSELREVRMVRIWQDRVQVIDVNGDCFEIQGLGYEDPDAAPLLKAVGANFKPHLLHKPIDRDYKEFKAGRRYPWAEDRVM